MDLGSFPKDRRTYIAALIDMQVELYNLGEDGANAIATLQELNIWHLASLVMTKYGDFYFNNLIFHTIDVVGDYYKESCTKLDTIRDSTTLPRERKCFQLLFVQEKKIGACLVDV